MKQTKRLLLFLSMLLITLSSYSQSLKPLKETNLPLPAFCSLKYFQTLGDRHIFYGKKPLKYNGKVILFVPGYIEEADFLLIGNSFYKESYGEGYQAAFLSMTRGEGDWVNGEILNRAIDQVRQHYKVDQIDIVAHSNGGKATEVALFHYGKDKYIGKVITLGTPYRGTQLADFAEIVPISWVTNILGIDEGRAYSTTYYCDNQWRPYFDKITTAQQKAKYYTYASWGYLHGRKILFSGAMALTGAIIKLNGGGDNDGATPFYSSYKPGAKQLFKLGASEGKMNHMDMVYAEYVWKNIKNILASNTTSLRSIEISNPVEEQFLASSNYQILTEDTSLNSLQKDIEANKLDITLIKEVQNTSFSLINNQSKTNISFDSNTSNMLRSSDTENSNIEKLSISFENNTLRSTPGNGLDGTNFSINGDSRFIAFAEQDIDTPMTYKFYEKGYNTVLEVDFPTLDKETKSKINVTAKSYYIGSLEGDTSNKGEEKNIEFNFDGEKFFYNTQNNQNGIYSILLTGKIEGIYKRDLISGFTIGNLNQLEPVYQRNTEDTDITGSDSDFISIYPIPAKDNLNVSTIEDISYFICDTHGRIQMSGKIESGNTTLSLQNLATGIYLFNAQGNSFKKTIKFSIK